MKEGGKMKAGDRVRVTEGSGYWDTTEFGYGGCFRRSVGEAGVVVEVFVYKGREARVKLDDGRVAVVKVQNLEVV